MHRNKVWVSDCRSIANVKEPEERYHRPQLSAKGYIEGKFVRVPQRPTATHRHPLENQEGPFLPPLLSLPSSFFEMGKEMVSQVQGLRKSNI